MSIDFRARVAAIVEGLKPQKAAELVIAANLVAGEFGKRAPLGVSLAAVAR
jgi:hypothetical protein